MLRDLLSMTSGLAYEFPWDDHPGLPTVEFADELGRRGLDLARRAAGELRWELDRYAGPRRSEFLRRLSAASGE